MPAWVLHDQDKVLLIRKVLLWSRNHTGKSWSQYQTHLFVFNPVAFPSGLEQTLLLDSYWKFLEVISVFHPQLWFYYLSWNSAFAALNVLHPFLAFLVHLLLLSLARWSWICFLYEFIGNLLHCILKCFAFILRASFWEPLLGWSPKWIWHFTLVYKTVYKMYVLCVFLVLMGLLAI